MTPLSDYFGLLDLMLHECNRGRKFDLAGVPCEIEELDGRHALITASTSMFGIVVFFPGWYAGEVIDPLIAIGIAGDHQACFDWLPISVEDKRSIIARLPIGKHRRTLLTLSV